MTNEELHRQARELQTETRTASGQAKGYHQRRREAPEKSRPLLREIWAAFDRKETVGGFTSREDWAAWWNPTTKYPMRQIQRIINPKPQATSCRLTVGKVVRIGHKEYPLTKASLDEIESVLQPQHIQQRKVINSQFNVRYGFFKTLTTADLEKAWKHAAARLHPDNKVTGNEAQFKKLNGLWSKVKEFGDTAC